MSNKYTEPLERKEADRFVPLQGYFKCVYCSSHKKYESFSEGDPDCCSECYVTAVEDYYGAVITDLNKQHVKELKARKVSKPKAASKAGDK